MANCEEANNHYFEEGWLFKMDRSASISVLNGEWMPSA